MNEQVVSNNWGIWKTDFAGINSEAPGERALKEKGTAIYLLVLPPEPPPLPECDG
jgi:hypothetical protein